ncbi:MAG: hypothetical protein C0623_05525 [Desulfuromonas sp.]|nr:MAG: hypothetical protein C0623_05525 [Desulfuromonas sp.]
MRQFIMILAALLMLTPGVTATENPIEVGTVNWGRDLDKAYELSGQSGKPVFVLFQEVPGCSGCQDFGRIVLSNPQLVEVIETEFYPVLVYNNRRGKDRQLLKRFGEPAWNFQVIRFLDAQGQDIIPRKDRVWTIDALAARMIETLQSVGRPVPEALKTLAEGKAFGN